VHCKGGELNRFGEWFGLGRPFAHSKEERERERRRSVQLGGSGRLHGGRSRDQQRGHDRVREVRAVKMICFSISKE